MTDQWRQRLRGEPQRIALRASCCQELVQHGNAERRGAEPLGSEPSAEMRQQSKLIGRCIGPIALLAQLRSETICVRRERSGYPDPRRVCQVASFSVVGRRKLESEDEDYADLAGAFTAVTDLEVGIIGTSA